MRTLVSGVASLLFALAAPMAYAQTCASPAAWHPGANGGISLTGTTCGNEAGIVSVCQGAGGAPGAAFVSQIQVTSDAPFSGIAFAGGSGYTLSSYLIPQASGCNTDAACTTVGDGSTVMSHSDIPPGAYYLIVTGADFDQPGACGTFSVTADGFLPVILQRFSVD
ncbi:hypothetical protein [Dokdonella ginsengisoli]|uniref:Uncharacterized protein n=1 Tax=Dokdonella ginsengisoli TaxID=363846 RepID=A0ABV9QY97_9GAMM